jgi:hypothetical protein
VKTVNGMKFAKKMKKDIEGWGLAESIIYATGVIKKAEVITGDEHFKKIKGVLLIK